MWFFKKKPTNIPIKLSDDEKELKYCQRELTILKNSLINLRKNKNVYLNNHYIKSVEPIDFELEKKIILLTLRINYLEETIKFTKKLENQNEN